MAFVIKVNYGEIYRAVAIIEDYIEEHRKEMQKADVEVQNISAGWDGEDARQFKSQWEKIMEEDSVSMKMRKAFGDYANSLRLSMDEYKAAQQRAIDRSNSIW